MDSSKVSSRLAGRGVVLLVALLLGSTTINYIDRQVLSVLAPTIRDEYRISNELCVDCERVYGELCGGDAAGGLGAGPDWGGARIDDFGEFVERGGDVDFAGAGTLEPGGVSRLAGAGESGAWPAFAKAVSIYVPARWKTLAMGVCNSGSSLGAMMAPPMVAWIALRMGWRGRSG